MIVFFAITLFILSLLYLPLELYRIRPKDLCVSLTLEDLVKKNFFLGDGEEGIDVIALEKETDGIYRHEKALYEAQKEVENKVLPLLVGRTEKYEPLVLDFVDFNHLLVGGQTGWGKSNFLNHLIVTLLKNVPQNMLQMRLIDPKSTEFIPFMHLKGFDIKIVDEVEGYRELLSDVNDEMNKRRRLFKRVGVEGAFVRDITSFNKRAVEKLPYVLLVVDECTSVLNDKQSNQFIGELVRKGRAFGVYIVLATQNPSSKQVSDEIRPNMGACVAFKVRQLGNSRVMLGEGGAENLKEKGEAIIKFSDKKKIVQTPLLDDEGLKKALIQLNRKSSIL